MPGGRFPLVPVPSRRRALLEGGSVSTTVDLRRSEEVSLVSRVLPRSHGGGGQATVTDPYAFFVQRILGTGNRVAPRGLPTTEVLGATVQFPPGRVLKRRGFNTSLALAESLLLVAGEMDTDLIRTVAPRVDPALFDRKSSYGPRVTDQVPGIVKALAVDPFTRHAVLLVENDVTEVGTHALPCTVAVQFLLRRGALNAVVFMRSSDAAWGLPYDLFQFSLLTACVAASVGSVREEVVLPGSVQFCLGSAHVYDASKDVALRSVWYPRLSVDLGPTRVGLFWHDVKGWAKGQLTLLRLGQSKNGRVQVLDD